MPLMTRFWARRLSARVVVLYTRPPQHATTVAEPECRQHRSEAALSLSARRHGGDRTPIALKRPVITMRSFLVPRSGVSSVAAWTEKKQPQKAEPTP